MTLFSFAPRQERVFILLEELAAALCEACLILGRFEAESIASQYQQNSIQALKNRGARILDLVWQQTTRQFILPFDPEDIIILARQLYRIMAGFALIVEMESAYQVDFRQEKELLAMITAGQNAAREIYQLITGMPELRARWQKLSKKCAAVSAYQQQSKNLYLQGTGRLYGRGNDDSGELMKWKEIYRAAEEVLDSCNELSCKVREMTVKYG